MVLQAPWMISMYSREINESFLSVFSLHPHPENTPLPLGARHSQCHPELPRDSVGNGKGQPGPLPHILCGEKRLHAPVPNFQRHTYAAVRDLKKRTVGGYRGFQADGDELEVTCGTYGGTCET